MITNTTTSRLAAVVAIVVCCTFAGCKRNVDYSDGAPVKGAATADTPVDNVHQGRATEASLPPQATDAESTASTPAKESGKKESAY